MDAQILISELKRRRVFRVLVGYGVVSFAVLQIIEPIMHALHLPDVTLTFTVLALAIGFPVAVVLAWAFDVNEGRVERTPPAASHTLTGTRLRLLLVGIGLLAATPGVVWYFVWPGHAKSPVETASTPAAMPSIAVLPFADMSPGKDQEYFSDGIAEEILDDLAHVDGLRVIGRTSSFSFKGKADDLRAIGEKLGAANILEGSVRKAGDRIKITAQLIKAADGSHLWSETFDRRLTDVFAVQEGIAKSVVTALKVKLLNRGELPQARVETANLEAYEQYLLGTHLVASYAVDDVRRAVVAFEKAIALDPNLAEAWARLSFALWWNPEKEGDRHRAIEAAQRAVALAPDLADGHAALATVLDAFDWDFAGGEKADIRALALAPNSTLALTVHCMNRMRRGRFDEAVVACRRAIDLDPLTVGARNNLTITYLGIGELAKARALNNRVLELSPASATGLRNRCALDLLEHNLVAGREHCAKIEDDDDRLAYTAMLLHESGAVSEAAQAVNTLVVKVGDQAPALAAFVFAWQGKADPAFQWLDKAYAIHGDWLDFVKVLWPFARIRADPRYTALLKKMNLPPD